MSVHDAKYRALVAAAPDAIVAIDVAGQIIDFNSAAEHLFGYLAHEVLGRNVSLLMPEPYRRQHDEFLRRYLETGENQVIGIGREVRAVRKDGRIFSISLALCEIRTAEEHLFVGIVKDISAHKATEARLAECHRTAVDSQLQLLRKCAALEQEIAGLRESLELAESALRERTGFLADFSHEIRSPLGAMLGHAEILLEEVDSADLADCAQAVLRGGRHLRELMNGMIQLAQIDGNTRSIMLTECPVRPLLQEIATLHQALAESRGLELRLEVADDVPATTPGDATILRQILGNLVSNAIKFTDRGSVTLRASVSRQQTPAVLRIDVVDTGPGLSLTEIARLFKPFARIERADQAPREGTGLGLVISKKLARLLAGDVTADGTPGVGSTFSLKLPLRSEPHVHHVPAGDGLARDAVARLRSVLADFRILIVDDVPDSRQVLRRFLESAGAVIETADNGLEAIERVSHAMREGLDYAAVVMDLRMPVMDGRRAASELRRLGYRGPILAVTADLIGEADRASLASGCDECLFKPVDRAALVEALRSRIAG